MNSSSQSFSDDIVHQRPSQMKGIPMDQDGAFRIEAASSRLEDKEFCMWLFVGMIRLKRSTRCNTQSDADIDMTGVRAEAENLINRAKLDSSSGEIFIATVNGDAYPSGFLWLVGSRRELDGCKIAKIAGLYAEEKLKAMGIENAFLRTANAWAKEKSLTRLVICVGALDAELKMFLQSESFVPEVITYSRRLQK